MPNRIYFRIQNVNVSFIIFKTIQHVKQVKYQCNGQFFCHWSHCWLALYIFNIHVICADIMLSIGMVSISDNDAMICSEISSLTSYWQSVRHSCCVSDSMFSETSEIRASVMPWSCVSASRSTNQDTWRISIYIVPGILTEVRQIYRFFIFILFMLNISFDIH